MRAEAGSRAAVKHVVETSPFEPRLLQIFVKSPQNVLYLLRLVLSPSIKCSGQIFTTPVSKGRTPIYAHASKHPMPRRQSARNSYRDTQAPIYVTHIRFHGCYSSFNVINVP